MQNASTGKGKSSYYSAMPRGRGLKFYCVMADPKVAEEHILTKCSKCNTFQVINDLVWSKNLKSSYYSAMQ